MTKNAQSFLRDGAYVTDPVLRDGQASFTPGISERRDSTTTFQHSGLKNADAQSSVAQTVTATRQYDAFGNLASSSGSWQGPFGYAGGFGYQTEPDSGLMLLGHRYLDHSTGRFLTRDPVKDGRNWYGYVANSPVGAMDSDGLDTFVFTGKRLKHFDSSGTLLKIYPALSGMPGSTSKDQGKPGYGPLPEGLWYFHPYKIQEATDRFVDWGKEGYYEPTWLGRNWGGRRVPLIPYPETSTLTRDGFFLHGGPRPQTAGCLQVEGAFELLENVRYIGRPTVKVVVRYVD